MRSSSSTVFNADSGDRLIHLAVHVHLDQQWLRSRLIDSRDLFGLRSLVFRCIQLPLSGDVNDRAFQRAGLLLCSLLRGRRMIPGNSRTAWAITEAMLLKEGEAAELVNDDAHDLVHRILEGEIAPQGVVQRLRGAGSA